MNRIRYTVLVVSFLIFWGHASAEEDRRLIDDAKMPLTGVLATDFVPEGWMIETSVKGDLNGDGNPDSVLELIEALPGQNKTEGMPPSRERALLILIQTQPKGFKRVGLAKRLLRCTDCFGMMAGPEGGGADIRVVKNVLLVEELWGSRETVSTRLRFRFDAQSDRFVLIGEDIGYTDRATGSLQSASSNLLTGIQLTETKRYDQKKDRYVIISKKKRSIPKNRRFIEDIDYREYEQRAVPQGRE